MKDISITFIRYFVSLVEHKKFNTAAAYNLHISQPALSKSIMTLEQQLGTSLLKRYPRSFELTDAGRYFYESSVYFLKLYEDYLYDIDSRVRSPYSGTIRMSSSGVILEAFFPDIIYQMSQKYPDIRIYTKEEDTNSTIQSLLTHKADFGTALYPLPEKLKNSFSLHHLVDSSFHLVFPKTHPFAKKDCISFDDLHRVNIFTPGEFSGVHQTFFKLCAEHSVQPNITCSCSQAPFIMKLVSMGMGVAVMPEIFLKDLSPDLTHRPFLPELPWKLALIYPTDAYLPLATSAAIDFIKQYFSARA